MMNAIRKMNRAERRKALKRSVLIWVSLWVFVTLAAIAISHYTEELRIREIIDSPEAREVLNQNTN